MVDIYIVADLFFKLLMNILFVILVLLLLPASGLKSSLFLFSTKSMQQLSRSWRV